MSAYVDDVTIMVLDASEVEMVGFILKEYESVVEAKNQCWLVGEIATEHLERQISAFEWYFWTLDWQTS